MDRSFGFRRARSHIFLLILIGASLWLIADWLGRVLILPRQVPASLLATLIGRPFLNALCGGRPNYVFLILRLMSIFFLLNADFLCILCPVFRSEPYTMPKRLFYIWIAIFVLVTGALNSLLNPTPPTSPSIGGGGYDLSKPVYTLLLWAFMILWTSVAAVTGMMSKDTFSARRAFLLAAIGALMAIIFFAIYGQNIH
ncbi:iron chelate uptake ABC transporter family permease subunit [Brucella pituitosa]|uniref:iron chelate uptake ABC transporter family permease subunit n=1 Tax=Brucella pituitosa TaxID=571256 RepID=UPI0009A23F20|nr:iron chelate uptake ABC transporter family permease subunit [Brucella pituitosa]